MQKRWAVKHTDELKANALQQNLKVHPVLCKLLVQRGVETYEQAKKFFRPELTDLHDPFLMKDMDKAVTRISEAISHNEKILIYGDYDVDGTTAVATVYSFFKEFYPNIDCYIPNTLPTYSMPQL
jgi:single-stranded-DNA-specific exonuclease